MLGVISRINSNLWPVLQFLCQMKWKAICIWERITRNSIQDTWNKTKKAASHTKLFLMLVVSLFFFSWLKMNKPGGINYERGRKKEMEIVSVHWGERLPVGCVCVCVCIISEAPFQSAEPKFQPKLWVSDDHNNDSCCLFALHGKACDTSAAVLKLALSWYPSLNVSLLSPTRLDS